MVSPDAGPTVGLGVKRSAGGAVFPAQGLPGGSGAQGGDEVDALAGTGGAGARRQRAAAVVAFAGGPGTGTLGAAGGFSGGEFSQEVGGEGGADRL